MSTTPKKELPKKELERAPSSKSRERGVASAASGLRGLAERPLDRLAAAASIAAVPPPVQETDWVAADVKIGALHVKCVVVWTRLNISEWFFMARRVLL